MTDEEIIEYFINTETMHIVSSRINKFQLAKHNDFKEYLENRYDDFEGKYTEIVTRIYFKIDEIPRCPVCGKKLKYHGFKKDTYGHWCSCKCQLKDPEFIKRRTDILDYKEIKKKSQETLIKRYGSKSYSNIDKIKETMLQRYGVEFYPSAKDYLKKSRETKLIKYGNEKYTNIEGICKTKLKKYGDKFYN